MKPGAKECGAAPLSNAPGFVFIRQKLMRSPLFEWNARPDIAGSGRVTRVLGLLGGTRVSQSGNGPLSPPSLDRAERGTHDGATQRKRLRVP